MQKTQYVYLLLYIRKFLRQSRAYLSIFEYKPVLWNIIWGEKNIVINCVYILVSFTVGSYWPHGTVNITFFIVPRAGLKLFPKYLNFSTVSKWTEATQLTYLLHTAVRSLLLHTASLKQQTVKADIEHDSLETQFLLCDSCYSQHLGSLTTLA